MRGDSPRPTGERMGFPHGSRASAGNAVSMRVNLKISVFRKETTKKMVGLGSDSGWRGEKLSPERRFLLLAPSRNLKLRI